MKGFDPMELDESVPAYIAWCPEMVAKAELSGLIEECGARVLWVRKVPKALANALDFKPKKRRLRSKQLDLFFDNPSFDNTSVGIRSKGVDKVSEV